MTLTHYKYIYILAMMISFTSLAHSQSSNLERYVETRVGTAPSTTKTAGMFGKNKEENGQTLPAVFVPHGMNFWTPQTQNTELKCIAPYYFKNNLIQGFRNSHWIVGGCTQDYGSMTVMSVTGKLKTLPEKRASHFSHDKEISTPSYYSVYLDDYNTKAEMTAQSRSAIFRFTYDTSDKAYIVINPNSDEGEGYIEIDRKNKEIRGYNPVHRIYQGWGESAGFSGYFVIKYKNEPSDYGVYQDEKIFFKRDSISKKENIGAFLEFNMAKGQTLVIKAASSFVSIDGARANLEKEIPHWNFELTRNELKRCWQKQLSAIQIDESSSFNEKKKFYSAIYRSSFLPHTINDVDGRYPSFAGGKIIEKMDKGDYYEDFSMWDTYRALHPLLTIIDPKRDGEMVNSLIKKYEQGGWLPIFPCWNSYTAAMIGDHCISVICDAYMKGINGFDINKAYKAMRQNAFDSPSSYDDYKNGIGRRALNSYLKYGYIPLEDSVKEAFHTNEQVSRTLEYAYDDYALSLVAKKLGKIDDYNKLHSRAFNYKNVINPKSGYAQGRFANGKFLKEENEFTFAKFVTEGAPCHYTWYVPQDISGLANIMGGKDVFASKLDSMFTQKRYWHGNEPCHQIAYLFNYAGKPWKGQQVIKHILESEYSDSPGGLSGNDDAGQMSAWYIFSSIGFYPVCPGNPYYVIGTPTFKTATINLQNGKKFNIIANNVSDENIYIQSAKLNGKRLDRSFIYHKEIMNGGKLEFIMGNRPNKNLWSNKESFPPSLSKLN